MLILKENIFKNIRKILFIILFSVPVLGFSVDFKFEHLTAENGLASNSISSIIQDKREFIWLGTQDGLCRYDGKEFKLYEHQPFNDNSLPHNLIQTMYYDFEKDLIWIGTYGGLSTFDPKNGNINHFALSKNNNIKKKYSRVIVSIKKDNNGLMWIGTLSGLITLDPETGELTEFVKNEDIPYSIPDNSVRDILPDDDGRIWIATYGGLSYFEDGKFEKVKDLNTEFPSNYIMDIEQIDRSQFLLASWDGGISYFNKDEKKLKTIRFPDNRFYFVKMDKEGHIWAGTWGGGLYYSENIDALMKSEYTAIKNNKKNIYSISNNISYSFFNDKSGLIWIGTNGGGLNKLNLDIKDTRYLYSSNDDNLSIPDERIEDLLIDENNQLWIGSYSSGLYVYDEEKDKLKRFRNDKNESESISNNFVNEIFSDSNNNIWIGTNNGINRYVATDESFIRYIFDGKNIVRFKDSDKSEKTVPFIIYSIFEDVKGRLWIGTYHDGVFIWDQKSGKTIHLHPENKDINNISDRMVFDIMDDKFGNVWIGTNFGLNIYNINSGEIKQHYYNSDNIEGLSNNAIMKIFRDTSGNMWIGTSGGGLNRYDYDTGNYFHYTKGNSLYSNDISGITEDRQGNIIVTTNKGISGINRNNNLVYNLASQFGLSRYELKGDIVTDKSRNIFISSNGVIFKIDTAGQNIRVYDPQVLINSFKINNEDYIFKDDRNIFDPGIINLSWKDNSFSFNFVSLDYTSPLNNRYEYMLEGFDKTWISSGIRNYANYTNIPPGKYIFKVRGTNSSGKWSKKNPSMKIEIAGSPFKSLLAYILYIIAVMVIFYSIIMIVRGRESEKRLKEENRLKNELLEVNRELDALVRIDSLTGAYNRHHFREILENGWHLHKRFDITLSLIMADIDFFKSYNDTYGHVAGDECLKDFTEILKEAVSRKTDSVFRYGGEEFIIVLLDTDLEGASVIAEKIRKKLITASIEHSASTVSDILTASMGIVSTVMDDYESADKMVMDVDRKLYLAKEHGRNTVIC